MVCEPFKGFLINNLDVPVPFLQTNETNHFEIHVNCLNKIVLHSEDTFCCRWLFCENVIICYENFIKVHLKGKMSIS